MLSRPFGNFLNAEKGVVPCKVTTREVCFNGQVVGNCVRPLIVSWVQWYSPLGSVVTCDLIVQSYNNLTDNRVVITKCPGHFLGQNKEIIFSVG